ncbi:MULTISPECIES: contact-dependent growth inhibition system immunity protein [Luteibacter]|uniref:contact-dependent growth inhibition system immunity protein n=1 Tax=Luteibacter TaxID=242605 RepID=UPI0005699D70|nr:MULTISPECIES: contact-dependent growth inhibition system immunity protein [unclassified Luteibacter]
MSLKPRRGASAYLKPEFILVDTFSGLGLMGRDPMGLSACLNADAEPEILGNAVKGALEKSRWLSLDEYPTFFDWKERKKDEAARDAHLIEAFGYKTRKQLYRDMKCCSIYEADGIIVVSPTVHERLDAWTGEGIDQEDKVAVALSSSLKEIGDALILGFSRCR